MSLFLLFFSFFFIWIPTAVYPPSHKLSQKKNIFHFALGLSVLTIILTAKMLLYDTLTPIEKANSLMSLSPLTFLLLYKKINQRSIKKYNRPIYFTTKYGQDRETEESTWSESILQFLLVFIPFLWSLLGSWIFK